MSEWKPKGLSRRHFLGLSFGAVVATGVGCSTDDGSKSGQQGTSGVCSANGAKLEELAEVVATDVLIIGGGVGGLTAAVKAKEANPSLDVLIVEKQTSGWAGKAPKIGGFLAFLAPNADADKFMDFQVRNCGFYLNDQQMLMRYVQSTYQAIEQFGEWGVTLARNPDGNLFSLPDTWAREYSFSLVDIDMMLPIRTRARELGTRILNKIHVVDLLKQGNRVVGAVGFHIVTGQFYIIKAKATVLANGSCGYKVRRYWVAGTGDGVAAAFRAGAEMRNAEYGNLYGHLVYQDTEGGFLDYTYLVNALGENLAQKYVPNLEPAGVFLPLKMALGMEKEVAEGRGPICFAPPAGAPAMAALPSLPKLSVWTQRVADKETKYGPLPDANREIAAPLHGETSCIKVDGEMRTSLEGLWAIGDTSHAGSALAGAMAAPPGVSPGSGIMYAVVSASWAGPSAARYAAEVAASEVDYCVARDLKEKTFAPLQRSGGLLPEDLIAQLQDVTAPMKYSLRRSKERLEEALRGVEEVKQKLPELRAKDLHYLSKCHEVKSMALCAELTHRAALFRTESRGFHFREDYPESDNASWLKWVILKENNGEVQLSTQEVPIGEYNVKPDA